VYHSNDRLSKDDVPHISGRYVAASMHLPNGSSSTEGGAGGHAWGIPTLLPTIRQKRTDVRFVNQTTVYLGLMPTHYGHFLLEGLSRLWWAVGTDAHGAMMSPRPTLGYYYQAPGTKTCALAESVKNSMQRFRWLTRMKIAEVFRLNVRMLNTPTFVPRLYVPRQMTMMWSPIPRSMQPVYGMFGMHARAVMAAEAASRVEAPAVSPHCLYLSRVLPPPANTTSIEGGGAAEADADASSNKPERRHMSKSRVLHNEKDVKAVFERHGFVTLRPGGSQQTFEKEVHMLASAAVVAGFQGTNLHNAIFMRPKRTVVQITAIGCFPDQNLNHGDQNQRLIAEMNDAQLHSIDCQLMRPTGDENDGIFADAAAIERQLMQLDLKC
jgi:hypothetical protein